MLPSKNSFIIFCCFFLSALESLHASQREDNSEEFSTNIQGNLQHILDDRLNNWSIEILASALENREPNYLERFSALSHDIISSFIEEKESTLDQKISKIQWRRHAFAVLFTMYAYKNAVSSSVSGLTSRATEDLRLRQAADAAWWEARNAASEKACEATRSAIRDISASSLGTSSHLLGWSEVNQVVLGISNEAFGSIFDEINKTSPSNDKTLLGRLVFRLFEKNLSIIFLHNINVQDDKNILEIAYNAALVNLPKSMPDIFASRESWLSFKEKHFGEFLSTKNSHHLDSWLEQLDRISYHIEELSKSTESKKNCQIM